MNKELELEIRNKLKSEGMTIKNLAIKIHTNPNKLEKILNGKDSSKELEERIIKWLNK